MFLAIDIGNTNVTLGLFEGETLAPHESRSNPEKMRDKSDKVAGLAAHWRLKTDLDRMSDEWGILLLNLFQHANKSVDGVDGVAIASVVPPLTGTFVEACKSYLHCAPLVVDAGVKTGVRIRYDDPKQVGADRVVDAAAVQHLYGGPACIVDASTATIFDAISSEGEYLGGAIAPGLGIAAEALFQRAAKLPRVDIARPPNAIGRNVAHSLQSGLLFGYVSLIEGMVARFRTELGPKMRVIGTGSLIDLIASETRVIDIVAPWLTLEGLRIVYELNEAQKK